MSFYLSNGRLAPVRLLQRCKDLGVIDEFALRENNVLIYHGGSSYEYAPDEAEHVLDLMLNSAPLLKKMAADLPRLYG